MPNNTDAELLALWEKLANRKSFEDFRDFREFCNALTTQLDLADRSETSQIFAGRVGFNGSAAPVKAGAITSPTAPSAAYSQAEAQTMKTAVDAIRTVLQNLGFTA